MADNIKAPSHYVDGREYEPKDVIRDWGLNFNLGSAVKYISRAGRKGDKLEDLQKAKQFLQFEIEAVAEGEDLKCIVKKIDHGEIDCNDIPSDLYSRYKDIRDAVERKTSWYTNGILGHWYYYQNIPDGYKARVIDKIAQEVLDSGCDIKNDISSDDLREAVIDRILEKWKRDEISLIDIPDDVWCYSKKIRDYGSYLCDECVKEARKDLKKKLEERLIEEEEKRISAELLSRAVTRSENPMKFEDVPESLKPFVVNILTEDVLIGMCDLEWNIKSEKLREAIIEIIIKKLDDGELTWYDLPFCLFDYSPEIRAWISNLIEKGKQHKKMQNDIDTAVAKELFKEKPEERKVEEEKSDIGMTCKEAAAIGDAMAKGFEKCLNQAEEKHDESELDIYCRGFDAGFDEGFKEAQSKKDVTCAFVCTSDVINGKMKFDINKIAQEVLDSARDIENDISSDALREDVIDRIVERIVNGELSSLDIPWRLFEYSRKIRNAVNLKYRDDPPFTVRDTITITFNFEKED